MPSNRQTLLCRYHYDPLDRLVDCTPSAQTKAQRFYLRDRLATEIQGTVQRSIMQHDDQLLVQQQRQSGTEETHLLATDQQRSVLNVLNATRPNPLAYSPYGHRPPENGLLSLLGFNGERPDPVTGYYLLGNGYRAFNPVLMRFNSPDSWSPFGEGGLNAYAYSIGDPVNREDPTGHNSWLRLIRKHWSILVTNAKKKSSLHYDSSKQSLLENYTSGSVGISTSPTSKSPPLKKPKDSIHFNFKKNGKKNLSVTSQKAEPDSHTWTYSKDKAVFAKSGLTDSAQKKFDTFQNSIYNENISPFDAAKLAGDTNLKKIQNTKEDTYQMRLSHSERVMFTIENRRVAIRQVGGHT